ncbi:glycerophosphodiester phosphodiesterase [Lactococcus termiticola]|uniref:Glycerophosphoryl diester phosphodiesterase n=1 Tax=Lactococcus termiticola TaxID=2169526 RepID=A0A2R5HJQ0_9LACT|nr:glycerophosphodiester phosphodiesterase [Lactococcus termiticola]GBG96870.1 glycerophosphoryl diester phosphodiesterase [Lactococcus termiticola]
MVIGLSRLVNKARRSLDRRKSNRSARWLDKHRPADQDIQTLIFAHRGSKCNRPENTLAAFREAIRVKAEGVELDVHLTADDELVVIHDEKIDRTTNGKGLVRKLTLAQLKRFEAGSWFSPEYSDERVPSLREVLDLLNELDFKGVLNIEVKTDHYDYPGIEEKLSQLMTAEPWDFTHLYSCFNPDTLARLKALEPEVETSYLTYNRLKNIRRGASSDFIASIHPRKSFAFKHPEEAGILNKPIRLWTINSEMQMRAAFHLNVAGIITDYPEKARRIREEIERQV